MLQFRLCNFCQLVSVTGIKEAECLFIYKCLFCFTLKASAKMKPTLVVLGFLLICLTLELRESDAQTSESPADAGGPDANDGGDEAEDNEEGDDDIDDYVDEGDDEGDDTAGDTGNEAQTLDFF